MKKLVSAILAVGLFLLSGCSGKTEIEESVSFMEESKPQMTEVFQTQEESMKNNGSEPVERKPVEPVITETDWSDYFGGLNGAAVFYEPGKNRYTVYNQELAKEQRSPCSTFKIISSLIGLESGAIIPGNSIHVWSGEVFWNESWNRDIDFEEAFRTSCVWYFREVVDAIGPEAIQNELNRLQYGNCDISDWEGRANTNNTNRALTGFWIESSLKISAFEQVRVLERIFGKDTEYKSESLQQLKQVMLAADYETEYPVYGKTGMGKAAGVVVDSWFTGFTGTEVENVYFCIYLGRTDGENVSSAKAKEIVFNIISDCY